MKQRKAIADIGASIMERIEILDIEHGIEDYVVFRWSSLRTTGRATRAKVRYNKDGGAYFISKGRRWPLNEAIKRM